MPRETSFHGRREELRGLSRGHSPAKVRLRLRAVSYGSRLAGSHTANQESSKSLPAFRCARGRSVRGLPQRSRGRPISRALYGLLIMPFEGFSENNQSKSCQREFLFFLRIGPPPRFPPFPNTTLFR